MDQDPIFNARLEHDAASSSNLAQAHAVNNFVALAALQSIAVLGSDITLGIGAIAIDSPKQPYSAKEAFILGCAMNGCITTCFDERYQVFDVEDLESLGRGLLYQAELIDEEFDGDSAVRLHETLEHYVQGALRTASLALQEAKAGFPLSGGDFSKWWGHPKRCRAE